MGNEANHRRTPCQMSHSRHQCELPRRWLVSLPPGQETLQSWQGKQAGTCKGYHKPQRCMRDGSSGADGLCGKQPCLRSYPGYCCCKLYPRLSIANILLCQAQSPAHINLIQTGHCTNPGNLHETPSGREMSL